MKETNFPSEDLLNAAAAGDVSAAAMLDRKGFLVRSGETPQQFADRIRAMRAHASDFQNRFDAKGRMEVFPGLRINAKDAIPDEIIAEASEVTMERYGFAIDWAFGYFPEKELGPLWGGCAVSDDAEEAVPVFIIRRNFAKRERWFIYSRKELLSHELCHAARMALRDRPLEEHFAYAISRSFLRRTIGNCFQNDLDAVLFILPALLLVLVQVLVCVVGVSWLPSWPFWILTFLWPGYLLTRNAVQTRRFRKAYRHLKSAGYGQPDAILFRALSSETFRFSEMKPEELSAEFNRLAETEFRWRVILARFPAQNGICSSTRFQEATQIPD